MNALAKSPLDRNSQKEQPLGLQARQEELKARCEALDKEIDALKERATEIAEARLLLHDRLGQTTVEN
jgi:hypothetical protein